MNVKRQNPANVARQVLRLIEDRQAFLQDQIDWRKKVRSLIAKLEDATHKHVPSDILNNCQVLVHKVPEVSEILMPLAMKLKERSEAHSLADSQLHDHKSAIDELSSRLNVSLNLPDERKALRAIQQRRIQVTEQLSLVEKRNDWWNHVCSYLPNVLAKWFFSGFLTRLQGEIDSLRSALKQLSSLANSVPKWCVDHKKCENILSDIRQSSTQIAECLTSVQHLITSLLNSRVRENTRVLENHLYQLPPYFDAKWSPERWNGFDHNVSTPPSHVVVASLSERALDILGNDNRVHFPVLLPFIGEGHHFLIECQEGGQHQSRSLFLSMMLRIMMMLPHHSKILLLDPKGQGRACPFANLFASIECQTIKMYEALDERIEEISRIIHDYIDDRVTSFDQLPFAARMNEKFEFIFAANFPEDYDRRSIELLQRISKNGLVAGKYLIMERESECSMPNGVSFDAFANLKSITPDTFTLPLTDTSRFDLEVDGLPDGDLIRRLANDLACSKPAEVTVDWHDVIPASQQEWWTHDSTDRIETSIGIAGRSNELRLWFGASRNNRPCAHGMLAAMTGSGKSNLYHVLICGLAARYGPSELRLYLIDGKDGVEFQPYKDLPHSAAVSLNTAPELARSILDELLAEKERRNTLFAEIGVPDLASYRRKRPLGPVLPRILLLVDEYQELLENDREGTASAQLLQIAQQGRNVGIHMLLGSQRFGVTGLLHQAAIFGNIHLRIAMKMAAADITALTEFATVGKRLIRNCDLPGKIVINDDSGNDEANVLGRVALLPRDTVNDFIKNMREKKQSLVTGSLPIPSVFDGKSQPLLLENPQLLRVLSAPRRLSLEEWEYYARRPLHDHGLADEGWYAGDLPFVMWIGQELNMYGQAHVITKRQPMENAMIVGGDHAPRYGMLACMLASLSCMARHVQPPCVHVVDSSPPGTPWNGLLDTAVGDLLKPIGWEAKSFTDSAGLETALNEMTEELSKRLLLREVERNTLPPVCLFIGDTGKFHELRKTPGRFGGLMEGSALGKILYRLCADGPALGIHCVLGFSTFASVLQIMDRQHIESFRHRVTLQMSEEDAFTFMRSRTASRLQSGGAVPVLALYADIVAGREVRFKPYSVKSTDSASEMIRRVRYLIKNWEEVS